MSRNPRLIIPLVVVLALCVFPVSSDARVLHVAPGGNDQWSGLLAAPDAEGTDGPKATLAGARDAIRVWRSRTATPEPVTVYVRGGAYTLTEPFVLGPEDSGTADAPVTYAAWPGESPVFSGGRVIDNGRATPEGRVQFHLPEVERGEWAFNQIFINGKRRTRARTPDTGYYRILGHAPVSSASTAEELSRQRSTSFRFVEGQFPLLPDYDDVNVVVMHSWAESRHRIAEVDAERGIVTFTGPAAWEFLRWGQRQRYYIENSPLCLDAPGEWRLDRRTGILTCIPFPGETIREVVAPVLRQLVLFEGDPDNRRYVEHIRIAGLRFVHTGWELPEAGLSDPQAASTISAAMQANGARYCVIERCTVAHTGNYALWFERGCSHNRIARNHVHDLGAGGIRLGETRTAEGPHVATHHNSIDNNWIHDGGRVYPSAVGVWIGRSDANTVSHNEISDFFYTGISVGWSWGYAPSSAKENLIEYNHVHHIGYGELSDMGGIYTLGISPGTQIRHNVFHHISSYSYGSWGIYPDEGSSDHVIENNLVYETKTGGFHQHYGRDNLVRNNIFAFSRESEMQRTRDEEHRSFRFERNIVLSRHGDILAGQFPDPLRHPMDQNVYWTVGGATPHFGDHAFREWQALGNDPRSIVADPGFADPENHDFSLRPDSPALALGFVPFSTAQAGLYGDADWVDAPRHITRPPFPFPVESPRGPFRDGFEETPAGSPPDFAAVEGNLEGTSILVTDETASEGRHALRFVDAAAFEGAWLPYLTCSPGLREGVAVLSLDLRVEAGAEPLIECRQRGNAYRGGAFFRISGDGSVTASGNRTLLTIPHEEWFSVRLTAPLGKDADGSYSLTFQIDGAEPKSFELTAAEDDFDRIEWFGIIADATADAVFHVDNVSLTVEMGG